MEIRKNVVWFEWIYNVSNFGNIKSLNYNKTGKAKILVSSLDVDWYGRVTLCNNEWHKSIMTHRIVSQTFIPNYEWKPQINHKNWIRTDNRIENLEWCTCMENIRHSFRKLWRISNMKWKFWKDNPNSIKIVQKSKWWIFIKIWESWRDVERKLWIDCASISKCIMWKRKQAGWFVREKYLLYDRTHNDCNDNIERWDTPFTNDGTEIIDNGVLSII